MKHVQIVAFCDGPEHADERREATVERTVSVDRGVPVILDLCEACDKTFVDLLALMRRGTKEDELPQPARTKERPSAERGKGMNTVCPVCGKESKNRSALGQHTRIRHGKGLVELGA